MQQQVVKLAMVQQQRLAHQAFSFGVKSRLFVNTFDETHQLLKPMPKLTRRGVVYLVFDN